MCLSIVHDQDKNTLCENVMMMKQQEDGRLDFYNILGVRSSFYGRVENINLMDNTISIWQDRSRPVTE